MPLKYPKRPETIGIAFVDDYGARESKQNETLVNLRQVFVVQMHLG